MPRTLCVRLHFRANALKRHLSTLCAGQLRPRVLLCAERAYDGADRDLRASNEDVGKPAAAIIAVNADVQRRVIVHARRWHYERPASPPHGVARHVLRCGGERLPAALERGKRVANSGSERVGPPRNRRRPELGRVNDRETELQKARRNSGRRWRRERQVGDVWVAGIV